ncbi:MAG: NAD(P)/FAD-dependent oxidoreductase [Thermomicrobiales bacterium]
MTERADVVIIGGGISGCAAAYELARTGARVILLEQGEIASMASGWTLAGVRVSGRHPAEIPLALAAIERWTTLAEELDGETDYVRSGNLRLARDADELATVRAIVMEQRDLGVDVRMLESNAEIRAFAPALAEEIPGAAYCPTDGHANPDKTVGAYAVAAARAGAAIRTHTTVTNVVQVGGAIHGVETDAGAIAADVVVNTVGVYADRICAMIGLDLPLTTYHVTAIGSVPMSRLLDQVLGVGNADFAGRQELSGAMRITDGGVPWSWPARPLVLGDIQPPAATVATVLQRAWQIIPALRAMRVARVWGGLLDVTPDEIPVIERTHVAGFIVAAGFSGHGFCLGPATGRLICDLATMGESSLPIDAFRLTRFVTDRPGRAALHG